MTVKKYLDVTEVLSKFGRSTFMPRFRILKYFHRHRKICTNTFIDFHMTKWSPDELFDIVKWGIRTDCMATEFSRRGYYSKAAELFLEAKDFDNAVKASDDALASPSLAFKFANDIRRIWLTPRYESKFREVQDRIGIDKRLHQILLLWQDPFCARKLYPIDCFQSFGSDIVRMAVLRCAPYEIQNRAGIFYDELSILSGFDTNAFKDDGFYIFEHYIKHHDYTHASRFASDHLPQWSNDHLLRFSNESDLQITGLPLKLHERGLFHQAALQYVKANNFCLAANASNDDLRQEKVSLHRSRTTLNLWQLHIEKSGEIPPWIKPRTHLWLLLYLFENPLVACNAWPVDCIHIFEPSVFQEAVINQYPYNTHDGKHIDPVDILQSIDKGNGLFGEIQRVDILRSLSGRTKDREKLIKHYVEENIEFWSKNMIGLSDKDMNLLLDSRLYLVNIGTELERRKMFGKATKLYLENNNIPDAISSSNLGLGTITLSNNNAELLVKLWNNKSLVDKDTLKNLPQTSKLWLLLHLFRNPIMASKSVGRQCMNFFGKSVVKAAVLQNQSQKEAGITLRSFDSKVFAQFGKKGQMKRGVLQSSSKPLANGKR